MRRTTWSVWALLACAPTLAWAQGDDEGLPPLRLERAAEVSRGERPSGERALTDADRVLAARAQWAVDTLGLRADTRRFSDVTAGELLELDPQPADTRPASQLLGRAVKVEGPGASVVVTVFDAADDARRLASTLIDRRYEAWEALDPQATREFVVPELVAQRGAEVLQVWGAALGSREQLERISATWTDAPLVQRALFVRDYSAAWVPQGGRVYAEIEKAFSATRKLLARCAAEGREPPTTARWIVPDAHLAFAFESGVNGEAKLALGQGSYWMARTAAGIEAARAADAWTTPADAAPEPAGGKGLIDVLPDGR